MLEVKNASIAKDGRTLFQGLSFTVNNGETAAVMGSSDDDLTLLLHGMMGLYPLAEGHVSIDGELLAACSAAEFRKLMTYVPKDLPAINGTMEDLVRLPFGLEANKSKLFSKQSLIEEWKTLGLNEAVCRQRIADTTARERQLALLSVAGLLDKPIILVDRMYALTGADDCALVTDYLRKLARRGSSVVVVAGNAVQTNLFDKYIRTTPAGA